MTKPSTRARLGRPPKDPADIRSEVLYLKLTPAERAAIDAAGGDRVTVWAREVILRAAARAKG